MLWPLQCLAIASQRFIEPSSLVRHGTIFLSTVLTWIFSTTSHAYIENAAPRQMLETLHTTYPWLALERLLISKWTYEARGPGSRRTKDGKEVNDSGNVNDKLTPDSLWRELVFATNLLFSPRGIGELWDIKHAPSWSSSNPDYSVKTHFPNEVAHNNYNSLPDRGRCWSCSTTKAQHVFIRADPLLAQNSRHLLARAR